MKALSRAMRAERAKRALCEHDKEMHQQTTERNIKLFLYLLHSEFGFGRKRLRQVAESLYTRSLELADNDTWFEEAEAILGRVLGEEND